MRTARTYLCLALAAWVVFVNAAIHSLHECVLHRHAPATCRDSLPPCHYHASAALHHLFPARQEIGFAASRRSVCGCPLPVSIPPGPVHRKGKGFCLACDYLAVAQNTAPAITPVLAMPGHHEIPVNAPEISPAVSNGYSPGVPRAPPISPA